MTDVHFARAPGGPLAYVRRGAGDPLLLIMGVAGHHLMWGEPFVAELARSFDVVAYDHRGIGESARAEHAFTITDLADDAMALLNHLGWESAHVMGISMGGTVAQELTLRHPDRVRRLVLGCTWAGPGADGGAVWGPGVRKLADAAGGGDPVAAARLMFEANFSPDYAAQPGRFREFIEVAGAVKVPGPVVMMQMQAAAAHDAIGRLAGLGQRTLVLHGTADGVIRHDAGERLAGLVPDAKLESFDGVGHLFFWEESERAAALVTSHLFG